MKNPKKLFNFLLPEKLAADLKEIADRLDIPQAQIVRAALAEKVRQLNKNLNEQGENQVKILA